MNQELKNYIENEILPLYKRNDKGHDIEHVNQVINRSMEIIEDNQLDVNKDISYTIAAYHDLGCYIDRKNHEKISAEIFMNDEKIKKWFSYEEIKIIREGIEDHRASSKNEPRSIYGKIVTTADKGKVDIDRLIVRMYKSFITGMKDYSSLDKEEQISRIYNHLTEKYGKNGYIKIWLEDEKYVRELNNLREILENKNECIKRIEEQINKIEQI